MPAAGRPDSKYVRKVHYGYPRSDRPGYAFTRCGKNVLAKHATYDPLLVTCRTCLLILDIPVGELDGLD